MQELMTQKHQAEQLLHNLPDDSTLEDIQYHLYVLEKTKQGQNDIANGKLFSQAEAELKLKQWL